jgi:hypothetical protein
LAKSGRASPGPPAAPSLLASPGGDDAQTVDSLGHGADPAREAGGPALNAELSSGNVEIGLVIGRQFSTTRRHRREPSLPDLKMTAVHGGAVPQ